MLSANATRVTSVKQPRSDNNSESESGDARADGFIKHPSIIALKTISSARSSGDVIATQNLVE